MPEKVQVLDHGYVQLVEHWGSDERIIEAARMSTDKGFQGWGRNPEFHCQDCGLILEHEQMTGAVGTTIAGGGGMLYTINRHPDHTLRQVNLPPGDEKLLRYLYEHKHMTPFEMGGLIIEVQAPIFVFREWHRHRTQSYNELSARYTPIPDVNYMPTPDRLLMSSATNKQAQGIHGIAHEPGNGTAWLQDLEHFYRTAEHLYQMGLGMGLPKEIARVVLPVGRYSRMRASANLRNWLQFLTLRMDPAAQWEIRQYANVVGGLVKQTLPRTWELFNADK